MAEKAVMVTVTVSAANPSMARQFIEETEWIYGFPDGYRYPGNVIPLRSQHDRLIIKERRLIGILPYVPAVGESMHDRVVIPYIATLVITFEHPSATTLDMLIRLGTWFNPPAHHFLDSSWSEAASPEALAPLYEGV